MTRRQRHRVVCSAIAALLALTTRVHADGSHTRVFVIVVDGLDAAEVTDEATPTLARVWRDARWCPGARSLAVMPARTNPNHATLITGVAPEVHGITGNAVWDPSAAAARKLGAARDLETETIFTIAHRANRGLRTAAAVGKPKLGAMFAADGTRQLAPDELWDARNASDSARDEVTGYAYDGTTLAAARALVEHAGADFVLVNLADVDRVSHGFGPQSPQALETRRRTDAALGAFLGWLATRADWSSTAVVITADHGFTTMVGPPIRFAEALDEAGVDGFAVVGDAGIGHVYLRTPRGLSADADALAAARRVALAHPGIAEALYRRPNAMDGGSRFTVAAAHPDWHLDHERAGDLLIVAKPGRQIVDGSREEGRLIGNHGGPGERSVPAIVFGGAPMSADRDTCEHVTPADLGRTLQACLGLPEVQRLDGQPVKAEDRGRVLPGICPVPPAHPGSSPTAFTPP